jgi:hypothetical protein
MIKSVRAGTSGDDAERWRKIVVGVEMCMGERGGRSEWCGGRRRAHAMMGVRDGTDGLDADGAVQGPGP